MLSLPSRDHYQKRHIHYSSPKILWIIQILWELIYIQMFWRLASKLIYIYQISYKLNATFWELLRKHELYVLCQNRYITVWQPFTCLTSPLGLGLIKFGLSFAYLDVQCGVFFITQSLKMHTESSSVHHCAKSWL